MIDLKPFCHRTTTFPAAIRLSLAAAGNDLLARFEAALASKCEHFSVKLTNGAWQPLCIEVLPAFSSPIPFPSVSVCHYFMQNGDRMSDPEIVFSVIESDSWMPYQVTMHPTGYYSIAFDYDGNFNPREAKDPLELVEVWASNLVDQGWGEPTVKAN